MKLFRLSRAKYGKVLSGKGASSAGARWNTQGTEIIYTADSRSLAMAEVAVHFGIGTMPLDYMMMTLEVPDAASLIEIQIKDLPPDWNRWPPLLATQQIGDGFIRNNEVCLLKVPSAVTQGDFNYLINPSHPEFSGIKIGGYERFPFDKRLFKT
ncbi:MAG: RES family NAD+ phosphorylase [Saprospiraceae bacterium]